MTIALLLVIVLGALSVAYGVVTAKDVLSRDAGTARMQEIAAAIAEGAQAYLRRQYTTIAAVGAVLFLASERDSKPAGISPAFCRAGVRDRFWRCLAKF